LLAIFPDVKTSFLAGVVLCLGCAISGAVDKTKPTARACIGIVNIANGDEEAFRAASKPGHNQKLVAHLDATAKCDAIVAPFLKSGELVPGWRPQVVELRPNAEVVVPKTPVLWSWEKDTGPLEIYVLFFAPGSKEGSEMRALVKTMETTGNDGVAKLQANKLRELIGRANFDRATAAHAPKADSEVAGVLRMVVGFEWRDAARAVNFSPEKPGALIFPALDSR
jgi:hypothetical protein